MYREYEKKLECRNRDNFPQTFSIAIRFVHHPGNVIQLILRYKAMQKRLTPRSYRNFSIFEFRGFRNYMHVPENIFDFDNRDWHKSHKCHSVSEHGECEIVLFFCSILIDLNGCNRSSYLTKRLDSISADNTVAP